MREGGVGLCGGFCVREGVEEGGGGVDEGGGGVGFLWSGLLTGVKEAAAGVTLGPTVSTLVFFAGGGGSVGVLVGRGISGPPAPMVSTCLVAGALSLK